MKNLNFIDYTEDRNDDLNLEQRSLLYGSDDFLNCIKKDFDPFLMKGIRALMECDFE